MEDKKFERKKTKTLDKNILRCILDREETMYFPGRIQPRASQVRNIHNFLIKIIKFVISRSSSFTEWHVRLTTVQG